MIGFAASVVAADLATGLALAALAFALGPARRRATLRGAWRLAPGRWAALALAAGLGGALAPPPALALGACCGPCAFGLVGLVASGALERRGRLGAARRLARDAVPWIALGGVAAVAASVAFDRSPTTSVLLALGGAVGGLGGLARKPRPAGAVALGVHVVALALPA